ncbi:MAG: hypothetical protein A3F68_10415 [Acidobacteria bacterium RIFCSPLOWO2_12_FULL_54_10]|nr:MAG: hypothetical protein A3F68_10415 [Acidobacteria bacterium RIFCSPLOWO2_12_FULL_54_10]
MKSHTREQVQTRKEKAARFVRDVLDDPDRATEIEDESVDDYADRRRFRIINRKRSKQHMATKQELEERISELEAENEELQSRLNEISEIVAPPDEEDEQEEGEDQDLGEE